MNNNNNKCAVSQQVCPRIPTHYNVRALQRSAVYYYVYYIQMRGVVQIKLRIVSENDICAHRVCRTVTAARTIIFITAHAPVSHEKNVTSS